jgi:hypothetical protein
MNESPESETGDLDGRAPEASIVPVRTPMFEAIHAGRYLRRSLIERIEDVTGRRLLCYVSGPAASIDRDDTIGFVEMLHPVPDGGPIDLILHTGGGDIDAAEKVSSLLRTAVGDAELRVIVPDFAKSAGTLVAIGADRIVMSASSELGPIDPQIVIRDNNGNLIQHSVHSYLTAYKTHSETLRKNPSDLPAQIMLSKMEPQTITLFETVLGRARELAERQLKRGMFRRQPGNFTQIAADLLDPKLWLSHAQMITVEDAQQIGLLVEITNPTSPLWTHVWQLYCHQRFAIKDREKIYESNKVSLTLESTTR